MKKITIEDISEVLGFEIKDEVKNLINLMELEYEHLSQVERDFSILKILKSLEIDLVKSGEHRIDDWEKGWGENLISFEHNSIVDSLVPKYHGKYEIVRWHSNFIKSKVDKFDYKLHICMVDAILLNFIENIDNVYEFGCGPGYHLLRLNGYNKNWKLIGCDWTKSSQKIISKINETFATEIKSANFDFFKPDYTMIVDKKSAFFTVAALEQIGENYEEFVKFILQKKPDLVINMEPIEELLDDNKLIDYLSIKYFSKRNYLKNYLPFLEKLEKDGLIEIIKKQKIGYGSFFVEGHSLIVWRPKK
jgi:hypothetical protein